MKGPRFFCDNCGAEVARNIKSCPHCGRFFANIRCPACGFSGEDKLFTSGCPSCGYSAPALRKSKIEKEKSRSYIAAGKLPLWVYIFSGFAVLFAFFLLAMLILR